MPAVGAMSYEQADDKYQEYKRKLAAWEDLFEEQYGASPTDGDCHQSSTWTALNEKVSQAHALSRGGASGPSPTRTVCVHRAQARYYKKLVASLRDDGSFSRGRAPQHTRPRTRRHGGDHPDEITRSSPASRRTRRDASTEGGHRSGKSSRGGAESSPVGGSPAGRDSSRHSMRKRRPGEGSPEGMRRSRAGDDDGPWAVATRRTHGKSGGTSRGHGKSHRTARGTDKSYRASPDKSFRASADKSMLIDKLGTHADDSSLPVTKPAGQTTKPAEP